MGYYIACYLTCKTAACRATHTLPQGSVPFRQQAQNRAGSQLEVGAVIHTAGLSAWQQSCTWRAAQQAICSSPALKPTSCSGHAVMLLHQDSSCT